MAFLPYLSVAYMNMYTETKSREGNPVKVSIFIDLTRSGVFYDRFIESFGIHNPPSSRHFHRNRMLSQGPTAIRYVRGILINVGLF